MSWYKPDYSQRFSKERFGGFVQRSGDLIGRRRETPEETASEIINHANRIIARQMGINQTLLFDPKSSQEFLEERNVQLGIDAALVIVNSEEPFI